MRPTIDENQADLSPADHQATGKVRFRAWRLSFRAAGSGAKQTDGWRWPVAERPLRGLRRPKADVQPLTAGSPPFGLGAQRSTDRNEPPAARPALALSTGNVEFPRSRRRAGDKMRLEGHAPSLRGPRSARRAFGTARSAMRFIMRTDIYMSRDDSPSWMPARRSSASWRLPWPQGSSWRCSP